MADEIDFAKEGLLDGLEGDARAERERLLTRLHDNDVPLEDLQRATANDTVLFLGADRLVGGGKNYTLDEVAKEAGIEPEFVAASLRAMGVAVPAPGDRTLTEVNIDLARIARTYRENGLSDEDLLKIARVLSHGLSQTAETMREIALGLALRPGASEEDFAVDFAEVAAQLLPMFEPFLNKMMLLQLRTIAQTEAVSAAEREAGALPGARDVAVGFADLVGFTRVGEEVPPDELGRIAARLERLTIDVIKPPVRLVKSIGDAVMLVSPSTPELLDSALSLVDAADQEQSELPQLRVGVAAGPSLSRGGDWYGRPVNLASRITAIARPSSVLTPKDVHDEVADDANYSWSFAGARRLKGIRDPVSLYRVRAAEAAGG